MPDCTVDDVVSNRCQAGTFSQEVSGPLPHHVGHTSAANKNDAVEPATVSLLQNVTDVLTNKLTQRFNHVEKSYIHYIHFFFTVFLNHQVKTGSDVLLDRY